MLPDKNCVTCGLPFTPGRNAQENCSQACAWKSAAEKRRGSLAHNWNGGFITDRRGYRMKRVPGHPRADCRDYVFEHRLVMEAHLGRYLDQSEIVHHRNGDKADNRLENLELMNRGDHISLHKNKKLIYECGWCKSLFARKASEVAGRKFSACSRSCAKSLQWLDQSSRHVSTNGDHTHSV